MSVAVVPSIGVNTVAPPRPARFQTQASESPAPAVPAPADPPAQPIVQSSVPSLAVITPPNTRLSIERDEATDRYVFRSVDENTGEVIRQYPTDEMLTQIARVRQIVGLTVDTGA